MKTPEEIKKGLIEAIEETSWVVEGGNAHDLIDACEMAHASMADALAYIQKLEAQVPRWISVEERLPEANMFAIVYVTNPVGWWNMELDCVDEDGNWTINADSDWHTVTHWMPLPEAPKEDEK